MVMKVGDRRLSVPTGSGVFDYGCWRSGVASGGGTCDSYAANVP